MPKYEVLVDGERRARVESEDEVRAWLRRYREEHTADDPDATHVQVLRRKFLGGSLEPRERFF